jgi:hypothetical protein
MNTTSLLPRVALFCLGAVLLAIAGCEAPSDGREERRVAAAEPPSAPELASTVPVKKALLFPNIWLETQGKNRRVLLAGEICLREGALELFLTKKQRKEHEAIVTAEVDGQHVHAALIAAGATAGSPVQFAPKFKPAHGTAIRIWVQYKDDKDKIVTVNARDWVKNKNTNKTLESDWVFAGSHLIDDPFDRTKPKMYLANGGDLICVSNFDDAMLDLPIESSKDDAEREYIAFTDRIPAIGTKVSVILEPVETKKDRR